MSVIIFFTLAFFLVLTGFIYVGLTIHHHLSEMNKTDKEQTP